MNRDIRNRGGFSLVEVTLALGVAGFCLIALIGLLPVAAKTNRTAIQQTTANDILTAIVNDFHSTPRDAGNSSKQYKALFPNGNQTTSYLYFSNEGSTGQKADRAEANTTFYATLTYIEPPAGSGSKTATLFNVKVSWPYRGNTSGTPEGSVETLLSLDRN